MYAIIRAGGKQYKVQPGDVLRLEKMDADLGAEIDLTDVLAIGGEELIVGEPTVKNAKVTVVVTNQRRAPKIIIFKKKRRQGYRRLTGHRQYFTEVFVKSISGPAGTATADGDAKVYNAEKKLDRDSRKQEYREMIAAEKPEVEVTESAEAPKKKAASKTAKKTAKTAGAARKKTSKTKSSGAKKSAAKKTKKKTSKS